MTHRIVVLAGDGVGPEVTAQAISVLEAVARRDGFDAAIENRLIGGIGFDTDGSPLTDDTLDACRAADAVLLGAVGGPAWDHLRGEQRCESGLLRLRKGMGVFANVRPVSVHPSLAAQSTLRPEILRDVDLVVVRELTGGVYFGEPRTRTGEGDTETAVDTTVYTRAEIERVARIAFDLARTRRSHVTSVDKANVLATSQLWRETVGAVAAGYPDVTLEHQLVDSCAMRLIRAPRSFDVIVTENLFGDILTDEAAMLSGSLGMMPSASLGTGGPGLYEPIHGSAPDIAGTGVANPLGAILSVALMLRYSLNNSAAAAALESAVDLVIREGIVTPDLGGTATTAAVGSAVADALNATGPVTIRES